MVALSVSISAITSPDLTLSPSFLSHLARLPFSMVGDSAGISTSIGMDAGPSSHAQRDKRDRLVASDIAAAAIITQVKNATSALLTLDE